MYTPSAGRAGAPRLALGLKKYLASLVPFGGVLTSSLMIAWATEVASFFLSRGLAFALLALLQVLPEFAVEAVITLQAAANPMRLDLVTANFTGANRLLVGTFLPLVFFVSAWVLRHEPQPLRSIELPEETALEVIGLLIPTLYSFIFALTARITIVDAAILTAMYLFYLYFAYLMPQGDEDPDALPAVPRKIYELPPRLRTTVLSGLFLGGGVLLFLSVEPFYHNTLGIAAALGIPAYFLFQWIAPLLSEFPELITVSYWARTGRAQLGVTNLMSSKINQWTLLIAMLPVIFGIARWQMGFGFHAIPLTNSQQVEILLTAAQALFAIACLMTLTFERWQAWTLALLWGIQAADPVIDPYIVGIIPSPFPGWLASGELVREWFTLLYLALAAGVLIYDRDRLIVFPAMRRLWNKYLGPERLRETIDEDEPANPAPDA